jgi:2-(1,2-epoxy-1,2-dihydrophenyl)acetyl-CoA isomerase
LDELLFDRADGIATITINRPSQMNAMTHDMWPAVGDLLRGVEHDPSVRCVVITGAGDHFCAGGDVKEFATMVDASPSERAEHFMRQVDRCSPVLLLMERVPQAVVVSARGTVAGGGLGFVAAADLVVASRTARFHVAQIRLGAMPDFGVGYNLVRSVGLKRAKQLALMGDPIDAARAEDIGLVSWVVDDRDLESRTHEVASRIAGTSPLAVALTKAQLNDAHQVSLVEHLLGEARDVGRVASSDEFVEHVRAFVDRSGRRT